MKLITFLAACLCMLLLIACDRAGLADKQTDAKLIENVNQLDQPPGTDKEFYQDSAGTQVAGKPGQQATAAPVAKENWDQKIIKTAALNVQVKDYKAYYLFLREKVTSLGGYIAQEEQTQSDYKIENSLSIKIPVDQFDNALVLLTGNVEKINEKRVSSQDVTTEMLDIRSRTEAKKQVRLRYLDLLKQAKNMEEILSVQSAVNSMQEEIEAATGRINYLGHSASFSTINLVYQQVLDSQAKDEQAPSFIKKLAFAFKSGWAWVSSLFLGLITVWPLFVLLFVIIVYYKRIMKRKPAGAIKN